MQKLNLQKDFPVAFSGFLGYYLTKNSYAGAFLTPNAELGGIAGIENVFRFIAKFGKTASDANNYELILGDNSAYGLTLMQKYYSNPETAESFNSLNNVFGINAWGPMLLSRANLNGWALKFNYAQDLTKDVHAIDSTAFFKLFQGNIFGEEFQAFGGPEAIVNINQGMGSLTQAGLNLGQTIGNLNISEKVMWDLNSQNLTAAMQLQGGF